MNAGFQRKIVYLVLIAALLVPVALLGRPAALSPETGRDSGGGKLASLREEYKLGQAQLGRIDPTSSAVRYVSLGLHGVAVCILQQKAEEYQKQEDWISLSAVQNQLTYLLPYYVNVWQNQAWNVSYNISSQWDDYRDKYYWVIRGQKLLHTGMQYNDLEPMYPHYLGWYLAHKLGQSDERREFRRLFAADKTSRNELLPYAAEIDGGWGEERDSWLYGKRYLRFAQDMVDHRGAILRSMSPENFHVQTPIAQAKYAEAIVTEGNFGDKAKAGWRGAELDWRALGNREFPSEYGFFYRIEQGAKATEDLKATRAKLAELAPGLREQLVDEKQAKLSEAQRQALATPPDARTVAESRLAYEAELATVVTNYDVAERVPAAKRDEARHLAVDAERLSRLADECANGRKIYNYDYWLQRSEMEQTEEALTARQLFYQALRDSDDSPWKARAKFDDAFARWRKILDKYPTMIDDQTAYEVKDQIDVYRAVLKQLDEPFDRSKFVLRDLLDKIEPLE